MRESVFTGRILTSRAGGFGRVGDDVFGGRELGQESVRRATRSRPRDAVHQERSAAVGDRCPAGDEFVGRGDPDAPLSAEEDNGVSGTEGRVWVDVEVDDLPVIDQIVVAVRV
jgi:hypothetical protein